MPFSPTTLLRVHLKYRTYEAPMHSACRYDQEDEWQEFLERTDMSKAIHARGGVVVKRTPPLEKVPSRFLVGPWPHWPEKDSYTVGWNMRPSPVPFHRYSWCPMPKQLQLRLLVGLLFLLEVEPWVGLRLVRSTTSAGTGGATAVMRTMTASSAKPFSSRLETSLTGETARGTPNGRRAAPLIVVFHIRDPRSTLSALLISPTFSTVRADASSLCDPQVPLRRDVEAKHIRASLTTKHLTVTVSGETVLDEDHRPVLVLVTCAWDGRWPLTRMQT